MKKILKYIRMKKILFILLILQLSVGIYLLTLSSTIIIEKFDKLNKFNSLFNYEKTYLMKAESIKNQQNGDGYWNIRKLSELEKKFDNLKSESIINSTKVYFSIPLLIDGIDNNIMDKYKKLQNNSPKEFFQYTSKIIINYDFAKDYNVKMKAGRWFKKLDFNSEYKEIPIVLGSDYEKNIKVGQRFKKIVLTTDTSSMILKTKEIEVEFVVIGIMEKNSIGSLLTKNNFIENYVYSDSLVLIPTVSGIDDLSFGVSMNDMGIFVEINNVYDLDKVQSLLNNEIKGTGLNITAYPLFNEYTLIKNNFFKDYQNYLILGIILLTISVVGVICVTLGEVNKRKCEFGIKLAVGSTLNRICYEVFVEMMILSSSSLIIAYILLYFTSNNNLFNRLTSINQMIFNLTFIIILTVILSMLPIISIKKMEIVDMIRSKK
ncbi:MAG: ABC transporter permease [Dermabacter sp.]|jgi:putative ABC transport system permease protein|nr:ABC transporter permease [Dermabacter sp.]MDU1476639.1 ABC transporter permease [Clostridium perfringens]